MEINQNFPEQFFQFQSNEFFDLKMRNLVGFTSRLHIYKSNNNTINSFIGIGGIGMSGLAQVMKTMGFMVQGSDLSSRKNVERCK